MTTIMIQQPGTEIKTMPQITVSTVRNIGGVTYTLTGCTVSSWGFAHTFSGRIEAEAYLATKQAQQNGYDAFFKGRDCKPPVVTAELADAWVDGWNDAHACGYEIVRAERYAADEAAYGGIEEDYSAIREIMQGY